jgi:hypothetical protein
MNKLSTFVAVSFISLCAISCAAPGAEPPTAPDGQPTFAASVTPEEEALVISPTATAATLATVDAAPAELLLTALGNATYRGILDEPVTLAGGTYVGEPFTEGGASRPRVSLLPELVAYGDLNGDGRNEAVVLLASDSGGSGTFLYLAAVEARDGAPSNLATTLLGDRVQVKAITIDGGRILVDSLSHAADDPACCPTLDSSRAFRLQDDRLIDDPN